MLLITHESSKHQRHDTKQINTRTIDIKILKKQI